MTQKILIAVSGWPDNASREVTRIIIEQTCTMAKCVTTAVANRLGGIHTIAMRVMEEGEELKTSRSPEEIERGQEILRYVTNRVH
jgi:hypothetical protein